MSNTENPDDFIEPKKLEAIFSNFFRLLLSEGRSAATMEAVANAVMIDPDLLRRRFKDETDLVAPAMRWYIFRFSQQVESSSAMYADIYSCMHTMLTDFTELCYRQTETEGNLYWSAIGDLGLIDPVLGNEYRSLRFEWMADIRRRLVKYENDLQDPQDIEHLSNYFMMVFEGIIQMVKFDTPIGDVFSAIDITMEALTSRMKKLPPHLLD
ncbi:hypothetical protein [Pseudovibrio sp. Tun.PSC04-5.I4]|uniref:TetR/AcrR family transcriptional regulator n=1 Tax=Pseudovibrio sp. Tun.PSC04-5.I4 TaxID=1798213 RepID=UPI0008899001|nr:hypothetical protein [Pseudovibrio sp. Tun.PSC04-5.I4]SDR39695.1 hypothetical protein SAMN04515695_5333 [Pseudovibrio sp. Tun.PSC04-5.I4]